MQCLGINNLCHSMVDLFQAIHPPVFAHIVLPLPAGLWHWERPGISRSMAAIGEIWWKTHLVFQSLLCHFIDVQNIGRKCCIFCTQKITWAESQGSAFFHFQLVILPPVYQRRNAKTVRLFPPVIGHFFSGRRGGIFRRFFSEMVHVGLGSRQTRIWHLNRYPAKSRTLIWLLCRRLLKILDLEMIISDE